VDEILKLDDVFIVSINKGLDWIQNPVNLTDIFDGAIDSWEDTTITTNECSFVSSCRFNVSGISEDLTGERYMSSCVLCPKNFPWLGNPFGV
jgi:hypothetical protein